MGWYFSRPLVLFYSKFQFTHIATSHNSVGEAHKTQTWLVTSLASIINVYSSIYSFRMWFAKYIPMKLKSIAKLGP